MYLQLSPAVRQILAQTRYFYKAGQYQRAKALFSEVVEHHPGSGEALYALANIAQVQGDYDQALQWMTRVVEVDPDNPKVCDFLGMIYRNLGDFSAAKRYCARAIELQPDFVQAHINQAYIRLTDGDFTGFQELEWRKKQESYLREYEWILQIPPWCGGEISNKCFLIYAEADSREVLQLVRYISRIKCPGGTIALAVPQTLIGVVKRCAGIDVVLDIHKAREYCTEFDYQASLTSLPLLCGIALADIPAVPYLFAEAGLKVYWRERIRCGGVLKVGIAIPPASGGQQQEDVAAIFDYLASWQKSSCDGISFYNLINEGLPHSLYESWLPVHALSIAKDFSDLSDAAALMANLDLVIGTDNLCLHIAGALGRPGLVLPGRDAHWRWLAKADYSPWYPTIRIIRPTKSGRYSDSIAAVSAMLKQIAHGKSSLKRDSRSKVAALYEEAKNFLDAGYLVDAQYLYRQILELDPNHFQAQLFRGERMVADGKQAAAVKIYKKLLRQQPAGYELLCKLASALDSLGEYEEAVRYYQEALRLKTEGNVIRCYAAALEKAGYADAALEWYQKAVKLDNESPGALIELGSYFYRNHEVSEAANCFMQAIAIEPGNSEAHVKYGLCLLKQGNYREGFKEYAWGIKHFHDSGKVSQWVAAKPQWNGENYCGKRLFVYTAEDVSQSLLFAQFLPMAAKRGGTLIVAVDQSLVRLMRRVPGVDQVVAWYAGLRPIACETVAAIEYLPVLFHEALQATKHGSYITPDPRIVKLWQGRMPKCEAKVCVACGSYNEMAAKKIAEGSLGKTALYLVQVEGNVLEVCCPEGGVNHVKLTDYAELAGFLYTMDFVIALDNSVAHLAGAIGKRTGVILGSSPSWIWNRRQDGINWYSSTSVFEAKGRAVGDVALTIYRRLIKEIIQ